MSAADRECGRIQRPKEVSFIRKLPDLRSGFTKEDVARIELVLRGFNEDYLRRFEKDPSIYPLPVDIVINSNGGDLEGCFYLCKLFKESIVPVHAYVDGLCQAAAFCVLQSCAKRFATQHSEFAFIDQRYKVNMRAETNMREMLKLKEELKKIQAQVISSVFWKLKNFGYSRKTLRMMVRHGRLFTAEDALRMRLLDEIIDRRPAA